MRAWRDPFDDESILREMNSQKAISSLTLFYN